MTKITVDKSLIEQVLGSYTCVLDTVRDWNTTDDLLWIQYSAKSMRQKIEELYKALEQSAVEPTSIRKQDAAIKQLRDTLSDIAAYYPNSWAADRANRSLTETEELK